MNPDQSNKLDAIYNKINPISRDINIIYEKDISGQWGTTYNYQYDFDISKSYLRVILKNATYSHFDITVYHGSTKLGTIKEYGDHKTSGSDNYSKITVDDIHNISKLFPSTSSIKIFARCNGTNNSMGFLLLIY